MSDDKGYKELTGYTAPAGAKNGDLKELTGYTAPRNAQNGDLLYREPGSTQLRRTPSTASGARLDPVAVCWNGKPVTGAKAGQL